MNPPRKPKSNPWLYDHEIPLRVHVRQLARMIAERARLSALNRFQHAKYYATHPREAKALAESWFWRRVWTLMTVLILIWMLFLYRTEFVAFETAIADCDWSSWEQWVRILSPAYQPHPDLKTTDSIQPSNAAPHHLVFVADPQLVDPHTYPGRPWPLSTMTTAHTDLYLRRAYSRIQRNLDPDTIFFLGDLFDGGREWATRWSESKDPDKRYKKHKDSFWMREYERFCNIFFKEWDSQHYNEHEGRHPGRRIIASLPGNHDLGFAQGVQLPVRDRFVSMFGESNRIDIIANHTFMSIDAVSLSAKDVQDAAVSAMAPIWSPTQDFLDNAEALRNASLHRHRQLLAEGGTDSQWSEPGIRQMHAHKVEDQSTKPQSQPITLVPAHQLTAEYPTVLLTHVPLYRNPGEPCGPLRERHPPSPGNPAPDERNALSLAFGYQYQNVISRDLTSMIIEKLGNRVEHVFSGDDHDYCEVVHRGYPSPGAGIREITVKSISWAMGVRRPGFLMVSLWNPVDEKFQRIPVPLLDGAKGDVHESTLQTHLCLLPDQLGIFIRYGLLIAVSFVVLFIRAFLVVFIPSRFGPNAVPAGPLLPTYSHLKRTGSSAEREKTASGYTDSDKQDMPTGSASSASDDSTSMSLLARSKSSASKPKGTPPLPSYGYGVGQTSKPASSYGLNGHTKKHDSPFYLVDTSQDRRRPGGSGTKGKAKKLLEEWLWSLYNVVWVVVVWYLYLAQTP